MFCTKKDTQLNNKIYCQNLVQSIIIQEQRYIFKSNLVLRILLYIKNKVDKSASRLAQYRVCREGERGGTRATSHSPLQCKMNGNPVTDVISKLGLQQ